MKTLVTFMIAMMIGSFAIAQKIQEKNIPSSVKSSFQKQYPNTKAKWSKEENNYEAEFNFDKEERSVLMDVSGNIIETEIEIKVSQLPKEITEYIKANYQGQTIKEAAKITDAKGVVTFEAEIKGKDLIFDSNSKLLKEVKN